MSFEPLENSGRPQVGFTNLAGTGAATVVGWMNLPCGH